MFDVLYQLKEAFANKQETKNKCLCTISNVLVLF
jgi:hypothetical protein